MRKMRALYSSRINESQIESVGLQPLVSVTKKIIDLFPVRGSPFESLQNLAVLENTGVTVMNKTSAIDKQALTKTLAYFSERGLDFLLSLRVVTSAIDPQKNVVRIRPNTLDWISSQYYSTGKDLGINYVAVYNFTRISHLLMTREKIDRGQPLPDGPVTAQWTEFEKGAIDFENLTWFRVHQHKSPETVGIEWLKNVTRNVDWPLLLPTIFAANSSRTVNVEIARDVAEGFDEMLQNHGSPLAVQGYFIWRAVKQLIGSIAPTCYRSLVSVSSTEGVRQKYCVDVLNSNLGRIAGHFFAKKTFSRDKQVAADEVVRYVRQAFIKAYGSQGWLSKTELVNGLPSSNESIVFDGHHGIQDSSHASEELKTFYKDYRIGKKYFFRNRMLTSLNDVDKPVNALAWRESDTGSYLATSNDENTVRMWRVSEEGDKPCFSLQWSSPHGSLNVKDANIQNAHGLDRVRIQLLKQRGIVGKPTLSLGMGAGVES